MFGFGTSQAQELFIMQSQENKDKVISRMRNLKNSFYDIYDNNAYDLILDALDSYRFTSSDFTESDWQEIQNAAAKIA